MVYVGLPIVFSDVESSCTGVSCCGCSSTGGDVAWFGSCVCCDSGVCGDDNASSVDAGFSSTSVFVSLVWVGSSVVVCEG